VTEFLSNLSANTRCYPPLRKGRIKRGGVQGSGITFKHLPGPTRTYHHLPYGYRELLDGYREKPALGAGLLGEFLIFDFRFSICH